MNGVDARLPEHDAAVHERHDTARRARDARTEDHRLADHGVGARRAQPYRRTRWRAVPDRAAEYGSARRITALRERRVEHRHIPEPIGTDRIDRE